MGGRGRWNKPANTGSSKGQHPHSRAAPAQLQNVCTGDHMLEGFPLKAFALDMVKQHNQLRIVPQSSQRRA